MTSQRNVSHQPDEFGSHPQRSQPFSQILGLFGAKLQGRLELSTTPQSWPSTHPVEAQRTEERWSGGVGTEGSTDQGFGVIRRENGRRVDSLWNKTPQVWGEVGWACGLGYEASEGGHPSEVLKQKRWPPCGKHPMGRGSTWMWFSDPWVGSKREAKGCLI